MQRFRACVPFLTSKTSAKLGPNTGSNSTGAVDSDSEHEAPSCITEEEGMPSSGGPQKLFRTEEKLNDKLVAVVVTLSSGASYDEMFQENQPSTVPGERVSTYSMDCCYVADFYQYLVGSKPVPADQPLWRQVVDDINAVTADSVTFNWECCGGCSDSGFPSCGGATRSSGNRRARSFFSSIGRSGGASPTMELIGLAMRRGFTVMCSDFSLKALIAEWSEEHLGPNPFKRMGACNHQFQLEFVPSDLQNEEVPQQLQVVGELCGEQGKAVVSAMSDTIVYTVNPRRADTQRYSLKVLSVVTNYEGDQLSFPGEDSSDEADDLSELEQCQPIQEFEAQPCKSDDEQKPASGNPPSNKTQTQQPWAPLPKKASKQVLATGFGSRSRRQQPPQLPEAMMCTVGEGEEEKRGMAGHVTLTYGSGGQLVTSMGHWIELTRINTSLDGIMRVAAHNFGQRELQELQEDMACQQTDFDREVCVQKWAKSHISKSVPTRMKCRTKY